MIKSLSQIKFDFHGSEASDQSNPASTQVSPVPETENNKETEESQIPLLSTEYDIGLQEGQTLQSPAEFIIGNEEGKIPIENTGEERPVAPEVKSSGSGRGRKAQKTYAAEADLVNIPDDGSLFAKQYYSIGEVSQMFNVNASLLRFWESEFDIIQPRKNRKGDRHFRPADIKNLQLIYDLLRRRKLTIEGAKDFLKNNKRSHERYEMIRSLQRIRSFLLEIKSSL